MSPSTDPNAALAAQLDAVLPQTQCTKCGFDACAPYAAAIAAGTAPINRCPPGGAQGIARLAAALTSAGRTVPQPLPTLDPNAGAERPRPVAVIDPLRCIGCTLCIQACPVDAIVGAPKAMHAVIAELCTGCDLCVPPCPVDCIEMAPASGAATGWDAWSPAQATAARDRYFRRAARKLREHAENEARLAAKASQKLALLAAEAAQQPTAAEREAAERKRATIAAALERARAMRAARAEPALGGED